MTQPYETRDYDLAILIILVILCWPAALIYYFTRPRVIRYQSPSPEYAQQYQPYQQSPAKYCIQCGQAIIDNARFCPNCGKEQTQT